MKVTSSMRALTPLERESILCLEEAFSNDQEWNFSSGEEDHVFERKSVSSSSTLGTNGNESDTSSVGSIIDLVGNLSDICVSSSSSPRSSEYASPLKSNQNNSNNQFSYQADAYHGVNDII
uniref:Uncharacterized protein n=1 Tax=Ciona savignyi TaxID=51511 RepID=H2YBZ1_CIOSA